MTPLLSLTYVIALPLAAGGVIGAALEQRYGTLGGCAGGFGTLALCEWIGFLLVYWSEALGSDR